MTWQLHADGTAQDQIQLMHDVPMQADVIVATGLAIADIVDQDGQMRRSGSHGKQAFVAESRVPQGPKSP
ncbi:MAG: hypothetical protein ACOCXA_01880 [Planctomycetota bacterium]